MNDFLKSLNQKRELFELTRAAYYAQTSSSPELRISLMASIFSVEDFRAVGQHWRPQQSVGRYQREIARQKPSFTR